MRSLMSLLVFILITALLGCSSAPQKEAPPEPDPKQEALRELLRYTKNNIDVLEAEIAMHTSMIDSNVQLADAAKKFHQGEGLEKQLTLYARQVELHQTKIEELERRVKELKRLVKILE